MNLGGFAALAVGMAVAMEDGFPEIMDKAAEIVQTEAKAMIGDYQQDISPLRDWEPLSASTLAEKQKLGYSPPDNPLLRSGTLRNSIERASEAFRSVVGSNDDVALWQELGTTGPGTRSIPPRSFLGGAAVRKGEEVAKVIWGGYEATLVGGARAGSVVSRGSFIEGMR